MLRLLVIVAIASVAVSVTTLGTLAFFTNTETASGNTFTAGTVDITVDGRNGTAVVGAGGEVCLGLDPILFLGPVPETPDECFLKPSQFGLIKFRIDNVGNNPVDVFKVIKNATSTNNGWSEPECSLVGAPFVFVAPNLCEEPIAGAGATNDIDTLPPLMDFDLTVVPATRIPTNGTISFGGAPSPTGPRVRVFRQFLVRHPPAPEESLMWALTGSRTHPAATSMIRVSSFQVHCRG